MSRKPIFLVDEKTRELPNTGIVTNDEQGFNRIFSARKDLEEYSGIGIIERCIEFAGSWLSRQFP